MLFIRDIQPFLPKSQIVNCWSSLTYWGVQVWEKLQFTGDPWLLFLMFDLMSGYPSGMQDKTVNYFSQLSVEQYFNGTYLGICRLYVAKLSTTPSSPIRFEIDFLYRSFSKIQWLISEGGLETTFPRLKKRSQNKNIHLS